MVSLKHLIKVVNAIVEAMYFTVTSFTKPINNQGLIIVIMMSIRGAWNATALTLLRSLYSTSVNGFYEFLSSYIFNGGNIVIRHQYLLYHFPALFIKKLNIFTGVDLKTGDFHGGAGE